MTFLTREQVEELLDGWRSSGSTSSSRTATPRSASRSTGTSSTSSRRGGEGRARPPGRVRRAPARRRGRCLRRPGAAQRLGALDDRDRALARQLAFGSVQRLRTLDHAIETLGKRPVRKLDPPVLAALRLGAYQLGYLDGVPRYAAVNESVELVRAARLERAVPFTNAVLRRVADGIEPLLAGLPEGPLKHSYPDWIWDVWRRDLGEEEALALMRAQNEPPASSSDIVRGTAPEGAQRTSRTPTRSTASTRKPWKAARSGRRAAARSSPVSSSARSRASACSTSVPPRAARRRCSPARSSRSR